MKHEKPPSLEQQPPDPRATLRRDLTGFSMAVGSSLLLATGTGCIQVDLPFTTSCSPGAVRSYNPKQETNITHHAQPPKQDKFMQSVPATRVQVECLNTEKLRTFLLHEASISSAGS